jgi:hypothetical protein
LWVALVVTLVVCGVCSDFVCHDRAEPFSIVHWRCKLFARPCHRSDYIGTLLYALFSDVPLSRETRIFQDMTVEQLTEEVLSLPSEARALLADRLTLFRSDGCFRRRSRS